MGFSFKTYILIVSFVFAGLSAQASEISYVPAFCSPDELILNVSNKTNEPQRIWAQLRYGSELEEVSKDVDPKAQLKIRAAEFLPDLRAFSLKAWDKNSLKISASCGDKISFPLSSLANPEVTHKIPSGTKSVQLHLLNLYLQKQDLTLEAYNTYGFKTESKTLTLKKSYDTESLTWNIPLDTVRVDIHGSDRFHSLMFYEEKGELKQSPAASLKTVRMNADPAKTYFMISTKDNTPEEAFIIALDRDDLIATARKQIKNPQLAKIVVAGIELGNGGFNRALYSKDKAPYSWSVYRVDAFADFAHIDCDGSPDLVEERLAQRLEQGGRICFWRYRVVKELKPSEVNSGILSKP